MKSESGQVSAWAAPFVDESDTYEEPPRRVSARDIIADEQTTMRYRARYLLRAGVGALAVAALFLIASPVLASAFWASVAIGTLGLITLASSFQNAIAARVGPND